jgi:penicillin-binding protein 1C
MSLDTENTYGREDGPARFRRLLHAIEEDEKLSFSQNEYQQGVLGATSVIPPIRSDAHANNPQPLPASTEIATKPIQPATAGSSKVNLPAWSVAGALVADDDETQAQLVTSTVSGQQAVQKPGAYVPTRKPSLPVTAVMNVNPTAKPGQAPPAYVPPPSGAASTRRRASSAGCLMRTGMIAALVGAIVLLCVLTFGFYQYYRIASQLPEIGDLRERASQFETTRIYDREGNVLYEILDPNAGRRTYTPLERISPYLVAATIATEDKAFYSHPGFDPMAIVRAFLQNYQEGGIASGASTITQQLARALLFSPEERGEQTYGRKIREAILAAEITRRYTKDEILELYLNEIYYGNLAYGVQAAAETYFGTTSEQLTLGQAAFLAGLPQTPSVYDIYTNPEETLGRLEDVLVLMYQASQEQDCIYVSNAQQRVCIDPLSVEQALNEIKNTKFEKKDIEIRYPHWVTYIRTLLETQFDPQTIYRSGFQVYTTLDPALQDIAQQTVSEQVAALADQRASGGALVALQPASGEILAMVGSPDFYNDQAAGQVNMAVSPRQPGSAIKPLTYAAAFEKGWTPGSLIWDVPTEFSPSGQPNDPSPPYVPVNYDGRFHGPVTVRSALANSYNIPAVKALNFVGIYDDPSTIVADGFINFARRLGITTLEQPDYGLSLTLGGGEVTLLQLTSAFSVFANNGQRNAPVAITRIVDFNGNVVYEHRPTPGEQVIRPDHAYLITSILADNNARAPMFGTNSVLNLPFEAAAKTGTTNDFRDNWTIGYTPDLAVGVWVGNPDYSPMVQTTGLSGAAPIWSNFMTTAVNQITGGSSTPFNRPGGIVEQVICAISGTLPSRWCPEQTRELFTADQPPLPESEDLWQRPVLDTWTGLLASADCPDFTESIMVLNVKDPSAKRWLRSDSGGQRWAESMGFSDPIAFAPDRECRQDDPRPILRFLSPQENETIVSSPLDIYAVADATGWFDFVRLEFGFGDDPFEWQLLEERRAPLSEPGILYTWDLIDLPPGRITLRLTLHSTEDTYAETFLHLTLLVPTPTPLPTATPTPTPLPTWTPLPTPTPTLPPTDTPLPTATIVPFPKATDTPPSSPSP